MFTGTQLATRTADFATDEEIEQFAQRIADLVAKSGAIESLCERIDALLANVPIEALS